MSDQRFAVVAVRLDDGTQRVMAQDLDERNAEAFIKMAVVRRGVDVEFYKTVPQDEVPDA